MRKIILSLAAVAAIASPIAAAGTAHAATFSDGTYSYTVSVGDWTGAHAGTTHYTCNADGSVGFTFAGDETAAVGDGHGTGLIKGSVLVFSGERAADSYSY